MTPGTYLDLFIDRKKQNIDILISLSVTLVIGTSKISVAILAILKS